MGDNNNGQLGLFGEIDDTDSRDAEWNGMPEFHQEDLTPHKTVLVHFIDQKDVDEFAKLIEQKITPQTKSLWFPSTEKPTRMIYTDTDIDDDDYDPDDLEENA